MLSENLLIKKVKILDKKNWSITLCAAETWTLRNVDYKELESFEMWSWTRMEKISWTRRMRN